MEPEKLKKPAAVVVTTVIFGILSFTTFVSPDVSRDPTGLSKFLQKTVCLAGFVGALSGTLWGRKVVIGVLSFMLLSSCAGFYAAARRFPDDTVGALITAFVAVLPVLLFYWYTFGSASKNYFREIRASAHKPS